MEVNCEGNGGISTGCVSDFNIDLHIFVLLAYIASDEALAGLHVTGHNPLSTALQRVFSPPH